MKGYHEIDGLDPSSDMIEIAESAKNYKRIVKAFIGSEPTPGIESSKL
jgi:hypothetical protein